MIKQRIKEDIQEELQSIKKLSLQQIKNKHDIRDLKNVLKDFIPDEIKTRTMVMVNTLINYQMQEIESTIDSLDVDTQNAFYDLNIREQIHKLLKITEHKLHLEPKKVPFTNDPRYPRAILTSGTIAAVGAGITYAAWLFDPTKIALPIIGGLATIAASAYAGKKGFEYAEPKAREQIREDVIHYLNKTEAQMQEWMLTVKDLFDKEFQNFSQSHGIEYKKG